MSNEKKKTGLATASMVLSITSIPLTCLVFAGFISAIISIVLGHISLRRMKYQGEMYNGKNRAIAGLIISYCYITLMSVLIVTIIYNRVSNDSFRLGNDVRFSIHIPLQGTSYEWQIKDEDLLGIVMAPKDNQIHHNSQLYKEGSAVPYLPSNLNDFEIMTVSYIPKKYDKTLKEVCEQLIQGTQVFDKSYTADSLESITISRISSYYFRESMKIEDTPTNGISFVVPVKEGYFNIRFMADTRSYNEEFYKRIALSFSP